MYELQLRLKYCNSRLILKDLYIMVVLLLWLVVWFEDHYSWENRYDPLCYRFFGRSLRNYDSLYYENLRYKYKILYARMFEGKCTKMHMDIVWWYSRDSLYESLHIFMQMKKIYDYIRLDLFTWRQLFGSLLVKAVKRKDLGLFTRRQLHIESLPVKAAKTIGFLYIEGSWPAESHQFRGMWVPLWISTVRRQSRVNSLLD